MRLALFLLAPVLVLAGMPATAQDRAVVEASAPEALAVTVYRDPFRSVGQAMNRNWPRGFAMISETRTVTLPPGESTIRFDGVAEGMVAVSAIVTGLPGGTIEKNRNADLLSPAALVDGTLGNRVRITRTNPAIGLEEASEGIIRTRADGGLVLQTAEGYEAVRCSGLPERLTFDGVPEGLSANPVFSIDTRDASGGTYAVTLTYLAWGFDWEASYVATIHDGGDSDDLRFDLTSWLTILNDNGQSFPNAELMAVAGTLNVVSDFEGLADPPTARPLRLTCYPFGSTAAGSALPQATIVVTARRRDENRFDSPVAMAAVSSEMLDASDAILAGEEQLGDLKLYRVPLAVDVNAQGLKQVAFLREEGVEGRLVYEAPCHPRESSGVVQAAGMLLETVNDAAHGLGVALPSGSMAIFERGASGELLVGEDSLRDYASGQDVEIDLGQSSQVFSTCTWEANSAGKDPGDTWSHMQAKLTNANPAPVTVRLQLGAPADWRFRGVREVLRNGQRIVEVTVPANGTREVRWQVHPISD